MTALNDETLSNVDEEEVQTNEKSSQIEKIDELIDNNEVVLNNESLTKIRNWFNTSEHRADQDQLDMTNIDQKIVEQLKSTKIVDDSVNQHRPTENLEEDLPNVTSIKTVSKF